MTARQRGRSGWKYLAILLGLAIAGYGGTELFYWYKANRTVEALAEAFSPVFDLHWDSVDRDITGDLRIERLIIQPKAFDDEIRIDQLTVRAADLPRLAALAQGRLPSSLVIRADGARVLVGEPLHRAIEERVRLWGTPLDPIACGDVRELHSHVLRTLDRQDLVADFTLNLRHHAPSGRFLASTDITMPGIATSSLETVFRDAATDNDTALLSELRATNLRLRYTDSGFNESRNYVCAADTDRAVDAFIDVHTEAVRALYGADADTADVYRHYARYGGDLLVELTPSGSLTPGELFAGLDLATVAAMPMEVTLNGHALGIAGDTALPAAAISAVRRQTDPAEPPPPEPRYVAVEPNRLIEHLGRPARITLADGDERRGILEEAEDGTLHLRRRLQGGTAAFPVPVTEINRAEVLLPQ